MKRKCYRFSCIMLIVILVLSNINIKTVLATEREREQTRLSFEIPKNVEPPKSYAEVINRLLAWQEIIPEGTIWNEHTPYGDEGYLGEYYEWTTWKGNPFETTACAAFAYLMSNVVFGDLPVTLNTNVSYDQIRPGDVLTINNYTHCVIVIQVYPDYLTVAEGNASGIVRWNRVRSKDYIMSRINYLETRYPDDFVDEQDSAVSTATSAPATQIPVTPTTTLAPATQTPVAPIATSAPATQTPVAPTATSAPATQTPITTATPVYKHAKEQRVEKPYTYLYDSNNDKVDMFMLKSRSLTYKGKKIPFKPIKWADFNESGTIIVVQKNSVYYSVKSTINGVKIKKLGKDAKKRQKRNGLIITITTKNGKKRNVANF